MSTLQMLMIMVCFATPRIESMTRTLTNLGDRDSTLELRNIAPVPAEALEQAPSSLETSPPVTASSLPPNTV